MQIDKQLKRIIFACSVCVFSVPFAFSQDVEDHFNRVFLEMYFEELPKHFKVEIKSIPISSQFAEKLYKMMVSFIENSKAKGIPPIILDGYSVSFLTVVADEVWSLRIHMPGGNAYTMANLCMKIISDAIADQLEEI